MMKCRFSSFPSLSRLAVLCIDEMCIKQNLFYCCKTDDVTGFEQYIPSDKRKAPATGVLVFFLRGFTANWKQPLSYIPLC